MFINNEVTRKSKTNINCLVHNRKGIDNSLTVTVETMDLFGNWLERNPGDLVKHGAQSKDDELEPALRVCFVLDILRIH